MRIEIAGTSKRVLPPLGAGVEARCEDVEVVRRVITRARIRLRCAGSLEVDPRRAVFRRAPKNILAFHEEEIATFKSKLDVRTVVRLDALAVGDTVYLLKLLYEVLFGYPSANGHLQAAGTGNEIEDRGFRHFELARELMDVRGFGRHGGNSGSGGCRDDATAAFGEECAVSLVFAARFSFETNKVEERLD